MKMLNNRNFPTGSQQFNQIIEENFIYVDKTPLLLPLVANKVNVQYFLSRPRRFGKSMLIDTLAHLFKGEKELFKDLYIYDKIEWESYPVIRISMDKIGFDSGLKEALFAEVRKIANTHQIILEELTYNRGFSELIEKLHEKYQKRVVVLIDEYDKPIINYIEKNNTEQAEKNRDILKSFYGILKPNGNFLRFLFITGVSKFSRVSIFSDLNQLTDLTLAGRYATICGFTEKELRHYCHAGVEDLAAQEGSTPEKILAKIKDWYDGFSWNGRDFVYNPYSTMLLMNSLEFKNYWFDTGTPTFLVKLINKNGDYDFKNLQVEQDIYNWHDLQNLDFISIMLQTGYLTFKKHIVEGIYDVYYPNKEVELSFSRLLLDSYLHKQSGRIAVTVYDIEQAFKADKPEIGLKIIADLFKTLPHQFFKEPKIEIDAQGNMKEVLTPVGEGFYHAVIYLVFKILGISMTAEVSVQEGRIDALVETDTHIYILEFKKNRKAAIALDQIKNNRYADHFALSKKSIKLIAVAFNLRAKGISDSIITTYDPNEVTH